MYHWASTNEVHEYCGTRVRTYHPSYHFDPGGVLTATSIDIAGAWRLTVQLEMGQPS